MPIAVIEIERLLTHYEWLCRDDPAVSLAVQERHWVTAKEYEKCDKAIRGLVRLRKSGVEFL